MTQARIAQLKREPLAFAVCMGWDAFRLAICRKPRTFSEQEVIQWLTLVVQTRSRTEGKR